MVAPTDSDQEITSTTNDGRSYGSVHQARNPINGPTIIGFCSLSPCLDPTNQRQKILLSRHEHPSKTIQPRNSLPLAYCGSPASTRPVAPPVCLVSSVCHRPRHRAIYKLGVCHLHEAVKAWSLQSPTVLRAWLRSRQYRNVASRPAEMKTLCAQNTRVPCLNISFLGTNTPIQSALHQPAQQGLPQSTPDISNSQEFELNNAPTIIHSTSG